MFAIELIRDQLSVILYRRLFYDKMREIVGEHRSARHRRLYALDCAIFLYAHRALWLAYLLHTDYAPIRGEHFDAALRNDVGLGYVYTNPHLADPILVLIVYIFALFIWICETLIWRLEPHTHAWRWWYEFVVINQDAYRDSMLTGEEIAERCRRLEIWYLGPGTRRRALALSVAKRVYCSIAARVRLWRTFSNVDQQKLFAEQRQSFLPNLSNRLRRKSILYLIVADYLASFCQMLFVILFFAVLYDTFQNNDKIAFTTFAQVWMIAELYIAFYWLLRLIHLALFFIYCSIFGMIVHIDHIMNINRPIIAFIRRFQLPLLPTSLGQKYICTKLRANKPEKRRKAILSYHKYRSPLWTQLTDHNKICYLVLRGSRDLFGSVMFAFLFTNLPVNIYLIRKIWFLTLSPIELIAVLLTLLCQLFATIVVIGPLARCCQVYHSPVKFIPRLQAITGKTRWLRLKLKYDDLYGRLSRGAKIGLSIGPMQAITYKSAFEFVCFYVAYLLMAFGQKIENNLKLNQD